MTGRFTFSVVVLIVCAAATAIGLVIPLFGPAGFAYGKGGSGLRPPGYYLASVVVLAGMVGVLFGSRGAHRYQSVERNRG